MAERQRLGTQAEYAKHRGVSRQAVSKAVRDGRIPLVRGRIDFAAADRSWRENTDPATPSNSVTGNPGGAARRLRGRPPSIPTGPASSDAAEGDAQQSASGSSYADARAFREVYKAKRERIAYEREIGLVVSAEEVTTAWFVKLRKLRDDLLRLPDRVPREARAAVKVEVNRMLEDLSGDVDAPGVGKRPARSNVARGAQA